MKNDKRRGLTEAWYAKYPISRPTVELQAKLDAHKKWIESNHLKGKRFEIGTDEDDDENERTFDFSHLDLAGVDFREAILLDANFNQSDLSGADFRGAEISSRFKEANLIGARFENAWIMLSVFDGALLEPEQLDRAKTNGLLWDTTINLP